jgi:cyclic lactone autoinducer peptide
MIRGKEDSDMKTKIMMAVSALATLVAAFAASSACLWWIYQPEEPASLQDK